MRLLATILATISTISVARADVGGPSNSPDVCGLSCVYGVAGTSADPLAPYLGGSQLDPLRAVWFDSSTTPTPGGIVLSRRARMQKAAALSSLDSIADVAPETDAPTNVPEPRSALLYLFALIALGASLRLMPVFWRVRLVGFYRSIGAKGSVS